MYKIFFKHLIILFLSSTIILASINFIIDPGEIYLNKILANSQANKFKEKLFESQDGIIQKGWNERLIKTTLAKESGNFDCIVLGSSHIMQISHLRNTGSINKQCNSLLNLGVSGGSIEDIAIMSYFILNNRSLPKKVYIDIDPWTIKFGMDSRYGAYQKYLNLFNILLKENNQNSQSYTLQLLMNLLNGEYFLESIKSIFEKKDKSINPFQKPIIIPNKPFKYDIGYKDNITLPDGSHIYSQSFISNAKKKNKDIPLGGANYKISGEIYSISALEYLKKIVQIYKSHAIDVRFIMTPYHPNVFKKGKTKPVKHFMVIEKLIKTFTKKLNIKLYGSFFSEKIGCRGEEFFDYMHPTNNCLDRIDFSI